MSRQATPTPTACVTMATTVCSVFVDVSEREQKEGNYRRLIEEKRIEKDMAQYNEWMKRGGNYLHWFVCLFACMHMFVCLFVCMHLFVCLFVCSAELQDPSDTGSIDRCE